MNVSTLYVGADVHLDEIVLRAVDQCQFSPVNVPPVFGNDVPLFAQVGMAQLTTTATDSMAI